jgi:DNA-binding MarR family transcriptional regulator
MPTLQVERLGRLLAKRTDEALRVAGLRAAHLSVLAALKDGAGKTQKELAILTDVEQPSMAQLLARMERDGLVTRTASPDDRRSSIVRLSLEAMQRLEPGRDVLRRIDADACGSLSPEERDMLVKLLGKLIGRQKET